MSTKLFSMGGKPVRTPDDWRLLMPGSNWQPGRSAERLATAWLNSGGFPTKVTEALDRLPEFKGMVLERGIIEHTCCVPGVGRGSETDLMVQSRTPFPITASIAVEGKVDEPFGARISTWLQKGKSQDSAANRRTRVAGMCSRLGLTKTAVASVQYQLLHRTYAATVEASAHGHSVAMLLVHSFSPDETIRPGWRPFEKWATALNPQAQPINADVPWFAKIVDGVSLWLLWVSDTGGIGRVRKGRR